MTACRPSIWLIGLLPVVLLSILVLTGVRERGEAELTNRLNAALAAAGHQWATVSVKGRDVKLTGVAFDETERDSAIAVAREVSGVRVVQDRVELQIASTPYSWRVSYKSNRVRIKGLVPSSNDRATILGFVKASLPDAEIDDRMKVASGSPAREVWLGAVSFGLTQLGRMKSGGVRLDGTRLVINGEAKTSADYEMLRKSFASEVPVGIQIDQESVTPPRIKPFTWAGQFDGRTVTLTGYVQNDAERDAIVASARQAFQGLEVTDRMELAIGAPDAWLQAINVVLSQLARTDSGRAEFSEIEITFAAVLGDKAVAEQVHTALRHRLPGVYKVQVSFQPVSGSQADRRSGARYTRPANEHYAGVLHPPPGVR